jgi:GTPase SAR1 family protein
VAAGSPPHSICYYSTDKSPTQAQNKPNTSQTQNLVLWGIAECTKQLSALHCVMSVPCVAGTDQRFKRLRVDGVNIGLSVWDTAGQDRFQSLTPMYYRGAQGVVYGELCMSYAKSWLQA